MSHVPASRNAPSWRQRKIIEMRRKRFGRCVVVDFAGTAKDGHALWRCECDCGACFTARGCALRDGRTSSCGCLRREVTAQLNGSDESCARIRRRHAVTRGERPRGDTPEYHRHWRREHPDSVRDSQRRYRAKKRAARDAQKRGER
jgi:hypothetical protein